MGFRNEHQVRYILLIVKPNSSTDYEFVMRSNLLDRIDEKENLGYLVKAFRTYQRNRLFSTVFSQKFRSHHLKEAKNLLLRVPDSEKIKWEIATDGKCVKEILSDKNIIQVFEVNTSQIVYESVGFREFEEHGETEKIIKGI